MSALRQTLRPELRLRLTQSLGSSLAVLRMSAPELCAALALESERNPFVAARLPEAGPFPAAGPGDGEVAERLSWRRRMAEQCRRSGWPDRTVRAVETLIHALDGEGYLKQSMAELRALKPLRGYGAGEIRDARRRLGQLAPPGMGAADLRERMLMRLADLPACEPVHPEALETARTLVAKHLGRLAAGTAESLGLPRHKEALAILAALGGGPEDGNEGVAPQLADIVVRKRGALWRAEAGPGLGIAAAAVGAPLASFHQWEPNARMRAASLWRSARNLTHALDYRRRRLLEIAQCTVDRQRAYFERGPAGLRPLRMADIAADIGASPATVSLAVRAKTVASPQGFVELKYLIPRSFSKAGGTREPMKEALKKAIAGEDPSAPRSDRKLAEAMDDMGAPSRRAVAKLRAELGIPPAHRRAKRPDA